MTTQSELRIMKWFDNNESLTVDLVDFDGNTKQETFYTQEDAIRDIGNLECEFDVYFSV